jgi:hypothetical protein
MGSDQGVLFRQLQDLRFHWGEVYGIDRDGDEFVASHDGRELRARTADGLRELIVADYRKNVMPCGRNPQ